MRENLGGDSIVALRCAVLCRVVLCCIVLDWSHEGSSAHLSVETREKEKEKAWEIRAQQALVSYLHFAWRAQVELSCATR